MEKNLSKLKVFGIGGCGSNIVSKIKLHRRISKILIDTHDNHLDIAGAENPTVDALLLCGIKTCKGLGCAGKPAQGYKSAKETFSNLGFLFDHNYINIFVTGLGGGTGSGITDFILKKLHENKDRISDYNKCNVVICTSPLKIELGRIKKAEITLKKISKNADLIFLIEMASICENFKKKASVYKILRTANQMIIKYISNLSKLDNTEILKLIKIHKKKKIIRIKEINELKNYVKL